MRPSLLRMCPKDVILLVWMVNQAGGYHQGHDLPGPRTRGLFDLRANGVP